MKKFKLLMFIDDDHPTNVYHRIILDDSELCESHQFFLSPQEALDYLESLSSQADSVYPDIIFLDVNMPGMTGWDFMEQFQQFNIPHSPVVIMLTTSLYHRDVARGEENPHIYRILNKPLEIQHLQQLCKELLHEA